MNWLIGRLPRFITSFWDDTSGIMLPYVAVMIPVIMAFSLLALDGARYVSLQTQMQAAADAIALAGARELDGLSGAETRAQNAMANAYSGTANTLSGMGEAPTLTYAYTFYQSLPVATAGLAGAVAATSDYNAKYVAVSVNAPTAVPTIFPASGGNSFTTGAAATAGFTGINVCGVAPIFICNPYETAGMTDAQATAALRGTLDPNSPTYNAATLRRQFRMNRAASDPGHFAWVQTVNPDGSLCNNTTCMRTNIAATGGACYNSYLVTLATGNKNSTEPYFDDRFDMYDQANPNIPITSANAPAINVRKGYLPGAKGDWCKAAAANPYYTTAPVQTLPPIISTTGTTTKTGSQQNKTTITAMPIADVANIQVGQMITGTNIPTLTTVVTKPTTTSITISNAATGNGTVNLTIQWPTSPLPLDKQWTGDCTGGTCVEGNGDWDCLNYWKLNHTSSAGVMAPAPAGCTSSNPTVSRFQVYTYENTKNAGTGGINDWSGNGLSDANVNNPPGNGENGAPYCAASNNVAGVGVTTGGVDRRNIIVPIINCLAQIALGTMVPGNNSQVPAAAFGTFFLTQPYNAPPQPAPSGDGTSYLYGEFTGLVGSDTNVNIKNIVQLYR